MDQKKFELEYIPYLARSCSGKIQNLQDIQNFIHEKGEKVSKRTIERWISSLSWLNQFDEFNRPAIHSVINSLVLEARKKRKPFLFIQIHDFPISDNKELRDSKVLVSQDGKGTKKWCYIKNGDTESVLKGLLLLTNSKPTIFFPSGKILKISKKIDFNHKDLTQEIKIETAHFVEPSYSYKETFARIKNTLRSESSKLSHLSRLEAESIHILREVVANAENPVMLYSVGKDSAVMLHLARKAFYPSAPPFPLMHVDTRWKFQAMYSFRDTIAKAYNMKLIIYTNPDGIEKNINPFDHGSALHTDIMKTQALKQALDIHNFDVAFGGARRDEEKSRAKERIFSFRKKNHTWDPKNQRPELWNLYNSQISNEESIRVFPLSNWTELDIWQYIYEENIPIVPLYFAAKRPVIRRNGMLIMVDDNRINLLDDESIEIKKVRFRSLGCYPLTGAVESSAKNLPEIILELINTNSSERQSRVIDSDIGSSMEKKKREGYF